MTRFIKPTRSNSIVIVATNQLASSKDMGAHLKKKFLSFFGFVFICYSHLGCCLCYCCCCFFLNFFFIVDAAIVTTGAGPVANTVIDVWVSSSLCEITEKRTMGHFEITDQLFTFRIITYIIYSLKNQWH